MIGRFPGETSCLTLVWAVLDLYIAHATNGIKFIQLERQHLERVRFDIADLTPPLMFLVGLAVGIDYALLIFARFRSELLAGASREGAVRGPRTDSPGGDRRMN